MLKAFVVCVMVIGGLIQAASAVSLGKGGASAASAHQVKMEKAIALATAE